MQTVLVRFEIEPSRCEALLAAIRDFVETTVSRYPGFIGSEFLVSRERDLVVNVARWTDIHAYEAFIADPDAQRAGARLMAFNGRSSVMTTALEAAGPAAPR